MVLAATSADAVPVMISFGLFATLAAAFVTPRLGRPRRASPLSAAELQDAAPKLFNRYFLLFVAGVGVINASHGLLFGFVSIYWKGIGISDTVIGLLWAWAVVCEVGIFLVFNRVFGSISASAVLAIAGVAAILRWIAYPLIEPLGLGVPGFFGVQTPACAVDRAPAHRAAEDDRRDGAGGAHRRGAGRSPSSPSVSRWRP